MPNKLKTIFEALTCFGVGIQVFPFQWWPLLRWQKYADQWGATAIITIGPIDLSITSSWTARNSGGKR